MACKYWPFAVQAFSQLHKSALIGHPRLRPRLMNSRNEATREAVWNRSQLPPVSFPTPSRIDGCPSRLTLAGKVIQH